MSFVFNYIDFCWNFQFRSYLFYYLKHRGKPQFFLSQDFDFVPNSFCSHEIRFKDKLA